MAHDIEELVRCVAGINGQCHAPSAKASTTVARPIFFEMQLNKVFVGINHQRQTDISAQSFEMKNRRDMLCT